MTKEEKIKSIEEAIKWKLSEKEEFFCKEYIVDFNGQRAAASAGYSEKTARVKASQLLTKVNIQERMKELKAKRCEKLNITSESVLQELYNWAYGDFTDIMELSFSEVKELPVELRRLITGFERVTTVYKDSESEKIKINFVSKEKAIELITKHLPDFYAVEKREIIMDKKKSINDLFPPDDEILGE